MTEALYRLKIGGRIVRRTVALQAMAITDTTAPATDRMALSNRAARINLPAGAPSATRVAARCSRDRLRTSIRLPRLAHAIASTSEAAPAISHR